MRVTRTHLYAFGERGTTSIPASYTRHVCFLFSREVFSCCACLKVEEPVLTGSLNPSPTRGRRAMALRVGFEPTLMRGRNRLDYPVADRSKKF